MKKDYNANTTSGDSEDEDDPRTPTSVSSQGSQGYDSAGSDFVDIEGFSQINTLPDSSLPEISLQVRKSQNQKPSKKDPKSLLKKPSVYNFACVCPQRILSTKHSF